MTKLQKFNSEISVADFINKNYLIQIKNYFSDNQKALEFLSNIRAEIQRNPKLLECNGETLINSFITMASLKLMPSGVSGEAYVLPYRNKGNMEAQFQLGYQGLITLFYRAGAKSIKAEIVYKNDVFSYTNGNIKHEPDVFAEDRGKPIGAYVIVETQNGGFVSKVMKKEDIMNIGKRFSKSFGTSFSPWNEKNDPELTMWKKTVLKQVSKYVPKNETIFRALAEDNKDSIISDRLAQAESDSKNLSMGNFDKDNDNKENKDQSEADSSESNQDDSGE